MNKKILIVYHSQSARNETLALELYFAALATANESDINVELKRAIDADATDLKDIALLLMLCPENIGNIAGAMKDFFDRIFYPAERLGLSGLSYGCVIDTGNDGTQCEARIDTIMRGMGANKIQDALIVYGKPGEAEVAQVKELAEAAVTAVDMGIY